MYFDRQIDLSRTVVGLRNDGKVINQRFLKALTKCYSALTSFAHLGVTSGDPDAHHIHDLKLYPRQGLYAGIIGQIYSLSL